MKIYTLRREQLIRTPRAELFAFFERPENLAQITPASLGFRILTPPPIPMHAGSVIDYTVKLLGLPVRWTTVIAAYEPPHLFVDVSLRGPYSFWHHTHTFDEVPDGVLITDEVRYALPFGFLGRLIHSLWVRHELKRVFDHRERVIAEMFG